MPRLAPRVAHLGRVGAMCLNVKYILDLFHRVLPSSAANVDSAAAAKAAAAVDAKDAVRSLETNAAHFCER